MNNLKSVLDFWLLESQELEEAKFNPEMFDKMDSPEQMILTVAGKLPLLGEGSSRAAFLLDSKRALKIAKNEKGLAQNRAEYELAQNPGVAPLVTRIYKMGQNDAWMVSELVRPLKNQKEFEQLTQVPWSFMFKFLDHYSSLGDVGRAFDVTVKAQIEADKRARHPMPGMSVRGIEYLPFIGRLFTALANRPDLIPADLQLLDHWCKTPDQCVLLLDSKYTPAVYASHYATRA